MRQCETAAPTHRAYGTVGTAIDRRIRLYFPGAAEKEADEHGVTMHGAFALCALRGWEIESLLGFSDAYSLDAAGFYLARQGQFIEWPLVELARDCSGGAVESWPTARDEFRRMAMALQSS